MAKKRKTPARRRARPRRRRWPRVLIVLLVAAAAALAGLIWPFWQLAGQFGTQPAKQPSRLYGAPPTLTVGQAAGGEDLARQLEALGYRRLEPPAAVGPGTFTLTRESVELFRRRTSRPRAGGGEHLSVVLHRGAIAAIRDAAGKGLREVELEPPLVASYYGPDLRERRPVGLDELPEELILAVLAAEDAYFLEHRGFSPGGILRAAWVNLQAQEVRQGGSTLTQQLVKNLYLSHQRTLIRKLREVVLAVFLELRYEKRAILQAYLNEIYWGRSGSVDLMGVGAAAWAYFGKHPSELDLAESALLAGMIISPARLSPLSHPEAARKRRDVVLGRLAQLGWLPTDRLEKASQRKLTPTRDPLVTRQAPYFAAAMEDEARRRFGIEALADAGFVLHSTLSLADQERAEEAVRWGLEALEKGWEKGRQPDSPLESALISVDPRTGAVLAYVGGRDYGRSQFDRVTNARRQAGSAFKPIVYATAYADRVATPATFLDDAPFTMRLAGQSWSPQNSDGKYRGWITSRQALEQSLNVPTARLAMDVGLERVIQTARAMGLAGRLEPYPALALGAMEVSPIELATVYATLAGRGLRPSLHGLTEVYDRRGEAVPGQPVPPPTRVLAEGVTYMVTDVLQGVLERGTGKSAREQGIEDPLAGKTGTTNDRRDSWFAGYSPERSTLVWVGYDDNSKTRLSGARAALPIWARFTYRARPPGGYSDFTRPAGVVTALIDPATGGLATTRCPLWVEEVFLSDFVPEALCPEHSGWRARPLEQPPGVEPEPKLHPFKRWLEMLKGRKKKGTGVI